MSLASRPTIEDWAQQLAKARNGGLTRELRKGLIKVALHSEREGKLHATQRMRTRSGRLRSSIRGVLRVKSNGDIEVGGSAGGGGARPVSYAAIQEEGGTVQGKPWLAIPLGPATTPAGVARYPRAGLDPTPMHSRKSKDGRLFLFPDDGGPPRYRLVRSVTIRGKHYLRDAVRSAESMLPEATREAVTAAVDPGGA